MNDEPMKEMMTKQNFIDARKALSERGETMPAAIITAIVSSIILLGITVVMSMVLQSKADQTSDSELTTNASNIDINLRSDITQATLIKPIARLTQPSARLLVSSDINVNGLIANIPIDTGECKVVEWKVIGTQVTRNLTVYPSTLNTGTSAEECDTSTTPTAQRTKQFPDQFLLQSPFTFTNHAGRKIVFTLNDATLTRVNNELDSELTAQGTDKLSDQDFNKLNDLLGSDYLTAGFADPNACELNADKIQKVDSSGNTVLDSSGNPVMVCPPAESASVTTAWNSTIIAKVSADFDLIGDTGEIIVRQLEQNTSIPLR